MLAELAAINGAFAIIKSTIANGKELASAGQAIADFAFAKEDLQAKASKKKNSTFGNDLQEFMALEEVKKKEAELKSIMYLYGRYGLWEDWVKFQADARRKRQEQIRKARLKRDKIVEIVGIVSLSAVILMLISAIGYVIMRRKLWL
ncbi:MAG: hypothetical protein CL525_16260 [Aequorivita sp.]|nr:hypothetical protein [Aequorivita sp.]|tara:strand:+ start:617 stop:1057 length:441 start_codon:yes stop_codon:yes gene_type:complete